MPLSFKILYCKVKDFDTELSERFGEEYTLNLTNSPPDYFYRIIFRGALVAEIKLTAEILTGIQMLQVPYKIDGLIYIPTRAEKSKEFSKAFFIWLNHMADKIRVIKAERGPDRVGEWKVSSHASGMKSIPVSENSFIPIFSWSILDFDVFQWEAFWDGNFAEYIKKFAIFEANQKLQGSRIQIADIGPENFIEEQTLFTDFLTPFENIHPGPQNQPKTAQFVKPKPNRVIKPKGHQGPKRLEETELWGAAKEAYELWDRKEINPKTKKRYTQIEAFEKFGFENIDEGKIAKYIDRIRKLKPS